eukprot:425284_1
MIQLNGDTFLCRGGFRPAEFKMMEIDPPEEEFCIIHCDGEPVKPEDEETMDKVGYDDIVQNEYYVKPELARRRALTTGQRFSVSFRPSVVAFRGIFWHFRMEEQPAGRFVRPELQRLDIIGDFGYCSPADPATVAAPWDVRSPRSRALSSHTP